MCVTNSMCHFRFKCVLSVESFMFAVCVCVHALSVESECHLFVCVLPFESMSFCCCLYYSKCQFCACYS